MAANMAETRGMASGIGSDQTRGREHGWGKKVIGGVAAAVIVGALIATVLFLVAADKSAMQTTSAPAPAGVTATGMGAAEYDAILEGMEKITGVTAPITSTSEQQRFHEENTILPEAGTAPYMEAVTPLPDQNR